MVGTVGGGTGLPSQRACLEILGLAGPGPRARVRGSGGRAVAGRRAVDHRRAGRGTFHERTPAARARSAGTADAPGTDDAVGGVSARAVSRSLAHAPLVAAFSASAVCFSSLVRGHVAIPSPAALVVAFVTSLLFFLQLRIADEFKDFEEDARFRPYRPVPRGLVTLRELAWVGVGAAAVQLALALWLDPSLAWLLALAWVYLALMTRSSSSARWLKAHPVIYMPRTC